MQLQRQQKAAESPSKGTTRKAFWKAILHSPAKQRPPSEKGLLGPGGPTGVIVHWQPGPPSHQRDVPTTVEFHHSMDDSSFHLSVTLSLGADDNEEDWENLESEYDERHLAKPAATPPSIFGEANEMLLLPLSSSDDNDNDCRDGDAPAR